MDKYAFIEQLNSEEFHAFQKKMWDEILLKKVEEAMGFELYDFQKKYILCESNWLGHERRSGRTTAYCIRLALSTGEPLDMKRPGKYSDMPHLGPHYNLGFFRHYFMDIYYKLKDHGFIVRELSQIKHIP